MKFRFTFASVLSVISMLLFGAVASAATDFTQFGFTNVVAEKKIKAGEAAKISHSGIKIAIPEGTFQHDVNFQVLEGDNKNFQANAPEGEIVIMNFAFKVTDMETGQLVDKFTPAITFSFKDREVNNLSTYYNVKTDGTFVKNNSTSVIEGKTLSHPVGAAPVGWAITSPRDSIEK